jgi:hypothetical protein
MSSTDRQNNLLISQDWTKIYQSFKNADFQSYDFENLRRSMIEYIRTNFPEDFNDYIESSEYLALIDLIAYVGQSIAFRVDLNARENFLELAERRDSILRLARLISYNASRNVAARGLLKFSTVKTTENVIDSNGRNLSGQIITWNDPSNANWYDQFIKIINAALPTTQQFGNPIDSGSIYGISSAQYRFNGSNTDIPLYSFTKTIAGRSMAFEITSTTFNGQSYIYEEAPKVGNRLACVYTDDGYGASSSNTGFFLNFTQGTLQQGVFSITQPSTNEIININTQNINNTDVWLYKLNSTGLESELWSKVPNLTGNNIIYNSLSNKIKNIYSVITRGGDTISLSFSDGTFGNLPLGTFRSYYRTSNNLTYTINPSDILNVTINIPYISAKNQSETLSITLGLPSSVSNAAQSETNASIKANAPATYYTQNRMITGEDYNISPLSATQTISKIKAVNRSSSGISRYFDLVDPTGKYSSTNLFADDGILYQDPYTSLVNFSYTTQSDVESIVLNTVYDILNSPELRNFYYANFTNTINTSVNLIWHAVTTDSNASTGYIGDATSTVIYKTGSYTATDLRYVTLGSLIKFIAPPGYYFDNNNRNKLVAGIPIANGSSYYIWAETVSVTQDGTASGIGVLGDGTGPIHLNISVPDRAIISQIIPKLTRTIDASVITAIIDLVFANQPFGLRYDSSIQSWQIIFETNLNTSTVFSLSNQGSTSNTQQDASWFMLFTTNNEYYTITTRLLRYVFESDQQLNFYFDSDQKIYDIVSTSIVKDAINVLNVNTQPLGSLPFTSSLSWEVISSYSGLDGYVDPKKIIVTFTDSDNNGVVDNPQLFFDIVTTSNITGSAVIKTTTITSLLASTVMVGSAVQGAGIPPDTIIVSVTPGISFTINNPTTATITNETLTVKKITYIIQKRYLISQGQEDYRYVSNVSNIVLILPSENQVGFLTQYTDGQYFYFIDTNVVKKFNASTSSLSISLDYKVYIGRDKLKFQYTHSADYDSRIDPGSSNIMDMYVLTTDYNSRYRQWLSGANISQPLPPSSDELHTLLSSNLDPIKAMSDEIIYHPVSYKLLFGAQAEINLQATFSVIKNSSSTASDNDIKARILIAINTFFALDNWNFGDTFYFTELSTYVMNQLAPDITNFVIIPKQGDLYFGALFEIKCPSNQIFLSCATSDTIVVVSGFTSSNLKTVTGNALTSSVVTSQNVTSANFGVTNG